MKRLFWAFVLLCVLCAPAFGQNLSTFGNITTGAATCAGANCVYYQLPPGTPWVVINVGGTWSGTINLVSITAPQANFSNLNSMSWSTLGTTTANGNWSIATAGATFVLVQASAWSSGTAQVTMASSMTGAPLNNPVFPGTVTANGVQAPNGGSSSNCWLTNGSSAACSSGGGSIDVNGSPVSSPDFNSTTPAAPWDSSNLLYQVSGSNVANVLPGVITYRMTGNATTDQAAIQTDLAITNVYVKVLPQSSSVGGTLTSPLVMYTGDTLDETAFTLANPLLLNFTGNYTSFTAAVENEAQVSPTTLFSGTCTLARGGSTPQYYQQATCSTASFAITADTGQSFDCTNAMSATLNLNTTIAYVSSSTVIQLAAPNMLWDAGGMFASGSYTCTETKRDANLRLLRGYQVLNDAGSTGYGPISLFWRDCNNCEIAGGTITDATGNWHDMVEGSSSLYAHDIYYQSGSGNGTDGLNIEGPAENTRALRILCDVGDDCVTAKDGEPDPAAAGKTPLGGKWGENSGEEVDDSGSGGSAGVHIYGICINGSGGGSCIAAPTDNVKVDRVLGLPLTTEGGPVTSGFANGIYVQEGVENASGYAAWPVITHVQLGPVQGVTNANPYVIGTSTSATGQEYGDISISGEQVNTAEINSGVTAGILIYGDSTIDSLALAATAYTNPSGQPLLICSGASNATITNLYSGNTNPANYNFSNCTVTNYWIPGTTVSGAANDATYYSGPNTISPVALTGFQVDSTSGPPTAVGATGTGNVVLATNAAINTPTITAGAYSGANDLNTGAYFFFPSGSSLFLANIGADCIVGTNSNAGNNQALCLGNSTTSELVGNTVSGWVAVAVTGSGNPVLGTDPTLTGFTNQTTPIRDTTPGVLAAAMTAANGTVGLGNTGSGNTTFSWLVTSANWYDLRCTLPVTFVSSATIRFELYSVSGSVTLSNVNAETMGNTGSSAAFQSLATIGGTSLAGSETPVTGAPGAVSETITYDSQFLTSHAGNIGLEFVGNGTNNVTMLLGGECSITQIN